MHALSGFIFLKTNNRCEWAKSNVFKARVKIIVILWDRDDGTPMEGEKAHVIWAIEGPSPCPFWCVLALDTNLHDGYWRDPVFHSQIVWPLVDTGWVEKGEENNSARSRSSAFLSDRLLHSLSSPLSDTGWGQAPCWPEPGNLTPLLVLLSLAYILSCRRCIYSLSVALLECVSVSCRTLTYMDA